MNDVLFANQYRTDVYAAGALLCQRTSLLELAQSLRVLLVQFQRSSPASHQIFGESVVQIDRVLIADRVASIRDLFYRPIEPDVLQPEMIDHVDAPLDRLVQLLAVELLADQQIVLRCHVAGELSVSQENHLVDPISFVCVEVANTYNLERKRRRIRVNVVGMPKQRLE